MMFALAIHYLNGWAMAAADGARKEQAEWPPHPDRVFMALAAAWFETGEDPAEGEALRWLETLPPPAIAASGYSTRRSVTSYVPVNDTNRGRKLPNSDDLDKLKNAGLALLPEYRGRQARGFPVAIPHDPTAHMLWAEAGADSHLPALRRLAAKLTHVGHSASLVQAWVDDSPPAPTWTPDVHARTRLRVAGHGRLDYLRTRMNRDACLRYRDLVARIEAAKLAARIKPIRPARAAWQDFPDCLLLTSESAIKQHPAYTAAKTGDADEAKTLVRALVDEAAVSAARSWLSQLSREHGETPILVSAHAYERFGVNAIPEALADHLADALDIPVEHDIVQSNVVGHTGADGFARLARQAAFDGSVDPDRCYVLVDDFVGQGGTLANLRGHLIGHGARVRGAIALTGKPYSAKLTPTQEQLDELRQTHGKDLEKWWQKQFGHAFDQLTQSEARYLARSPDAGTIRDRIAAASQTGNSGGDAQPGQEGKHESLKTLKARLAKEFPYGEPLSLRPEPGRWVGYAQPQPAPSPATPQGPLDTNLLVFRLGGQRPGLPTTLKLTQALRGLLMRASSIQPPPEWLGGHRADGSPSTREHMTLFPLPFSDAEHADGRVMGLAIAFPSDLDPGEVGVAIGDFLIDPTSGLPRRHRLFDGRWFECELELDLRANPPMTLRPDTWTRAAQQWASVTPVVLNRHAKGRDRWRQAAESLKDACEQLGLPRPSRVQLHPVSASGGVPPARDFPTLRRKSDGGARSQTHAVLEFDEPVSGPILLGAGRYRGYGLFRPMLSQGKDDD